jgi:hypothetical protein
MIPDSKFQIPDSGFQIPNAGIDGLYASLLRLTAKSPQKGGLDS